MALSLIQQRLPSPLALPPQPQCSRLTIYDALTIDDAIFFGDGGRDGRRDDEQGDSRSRKYKYEYKYKYKYKYKHKCKQVNRAVIASINSRVPAPSWRAGSTSLARESFSEVYTFILSIKST